MRPCPPPVKPTGGWADDLGVLYVEVSAQLGDCEDRRMELEKAVRQYQKAWNEAR